MVILGVMMECPFLVCTAYSLLCYCKYVAVIVKLNVICENKKKQEKCEHPHVDMVHVLLNKPVICKTNSILIPKTFFSSLIFTGHCQRCLAQHYYSKHLSVLSLNACFNIGACLCASKPPFSLLYSVKVILICASEEER